MHRHFDPAQLRPPFGRYHHVVVSEGARRMVFISGQLAVRHDGTLPETAEAQAEQVFAALDACLEAAEMRREHVTRLTAYLTEIDDRVAYMRVRDAWVADPPPASTLVIVKALALPDARIEVEAIGAA